MPVTIRNAIAQQDRSATAGSPAQPTLGPVSGTPPLGLSPRSSWPSCRRNVHQGGAANPISFVWDGDDLLNDYIAGGVSVRYDVLDGEVFGHKGGANRYLYVPDPLGNIVNLLDTNQTIAGTYVYWPYGEVQSHTGASTPMQFLGALGYQTQIANRVYAKAACYRPDLGRRQTRGASRRREGQGSLRTHASDALQPAPVLQWPTCSGDPCDYAPWPPISSGVVGMTVCCGGKAYACVRPWPVIWAGSPPAQDVLDFVRFCVQEHENQHVRDCSGMCACLPWFRGPCVLGSPWLLVSECEAHAKSAECGDRMRRYKCTTAECVQALTEYMCESCAFLVSRGCHTTPALCKECSRLP